MLFRSVALSASCIEILKALAMSGLYEAMLQQTDDQPRHHETAAFVLLITSACLTIIYLIALTILSFFVTLAADHFIAFAALGSRILFDIATFQPQARLAEQLAFRRLAVRTMASISGAGTIGVIAALLIDPFTGLIASQIAQSVIGLLTTLVGTGAAVWPRLHLDCFHRMRREATMASGVRLLAACGNHLDQIMVAMLIGSIPLAYYNLGKRIEAAFLTTAGSFTGIVFQPIFARRQLEGRDGDLWKSIAIMTILLGFPAAVFVPNSSFVITTIFGEQWGGASAVAAVLAVSGCVRAVAFVPGALMSVTGHNRELLMISLGAALAGVLLIALTAPFGIVWCAAALLVIQFGIIGCMCVALRREAPRLMQIYCTMFMAPFLLMLAGTTVGHWAFDDAASGDGILRQLLKLTGSISLGAVTGSVYFACCFRRDLAGYFRMVRAWPATVA